MAGAGGFEPPDGGIKIRCLTTWLRPNASQGSNGLGGKRADNSSGSTASQRLNGRNLLRFGTRLVQPTVIPILFERDSSRSNPRNGAGAHSRFGHKAMIGSDHRVLVEARNGIKMDSSSRPPGLGPRGEAIQGLSGTFLHLWIATSPRPAEETSFRPPIAPSGDSRPRRVPGRGVLRRSKPITPPSLAAWRECRAAIGRPDLGASGRCAEAFPPRGRTVSATGFPTAGSCHVLAPCRQTKSRAGHAAPGAEIALPLLNRRPSPIATTTA